MTKNYTGTVESDGSWSIEVTDELEDGDYTVDAEITDEAGNTTKTTGDLTIDTQAPDLKVEDKVTNNTSPTIEGTTDPEEEGNTVKITVDGEDYTGEVDGDGNWSIEVTDELEDGGLHCRSRDYR